MSDSNEPDNLVLRTLREMRGDMREMREEMATKRDLTELREELRAELATKADKADLAQLATKTELAIFRRDLTEKVEGLRQSVTDYHSSVVGHGVIIGELEARVRRIERHLQLANEE